MPARAATWGGMRRILIGVGLGALFGAGCAVGASSLAVHRANAAYVVEQRWAYFCFQGDTVDDVHYKANAAGRRGWEMIAAAPSTSGGPIWCFRQPQP